MLEKGSGKALIATSELGISAPTTVPRTGSQLSGRADAVLAVLPNQLQENRWGVGTLYLQFPFPCFFPGEGQTLPPARPPDPRRHPHVPWGGLPAPGRAATRHPRGTEPTARPNPCKAVQKHRLRNPSSPEPRHVSICCHCFFSQAAVR